MLQNKKKSIFILLFACPFLMGTCIDLYVPSLPIIADYFHVSESLIQLTISSYMLSYALGQFFLGVLSDTIGRRKILLFSSLTFILASFIAPFSSSIYILIVCRFLQGLGTAGMAVTIRAVAVDYFTGSSIAKAMNNISIGWSLGPILGPFIGGYLQHYFNWQADFYFFGGYGFIVFLLIFFTIPETHLNLQPLHPKKIFINVKTVLAHKVFVFAAFACYTFYALSVIFNMVGPFLIQKILGFSAVAYGKMALLLGISYFLGNITNRILINHLKPTYIALSAVIAAIFIALVMLGFSLFLPINIYAILIPVLIILFLGGLIVPNMIGKSSTVFPAHVGGTVSALFGSVGLLATFAISVFTALLKTNTAFPLSLLYVSLILFVSVLLIRILKSEKEAARR
ncbi:MAG: multidrug effflux MFS transporter [Gammaproteobacteria bacterium]|jgi:Bcr/CflA subfamily drug resistance transporter